jgi:alpha-tubulin suppressor-like RCC1 family protein
LQKPKSYGMTPENDDGSCQDRALRSFLIFKALARWKPMKTRTAVGTMLAIVIIALGLATPGTSRAAPRSNGVNQRSYSSTVYNWGVPDGNRGIKAGLQHSTPTAVREIRQTIVQIATSNSDTYALTSTGAVWAWGADGDGELGDGTSDKFVSRPVQVQFPAGVTIVSLPSPMPYDTALAIDSQGNVWGWGYDQHSELCLSSYGDLLWPTELPLSDVTLASGAGGHALFDSRGRVYACGVNTYGQLGNATTTDSPTPTAVLGLPFGPVKALVSSWEGSGALMGDGSYYDWGYNTDDQLGDGGTSSSPLPLFVHLPTAVTQVSQGGSDAANGQTVAILSDGSVWSWGSGRWGQLGDGSTEKASSPVQVSVPSGVTFTQVDSGGATCYAIDSNGNAWAWGENNVGQLGTGGTTATSTPVSLGIVLTQVSSTATNVAGLQSGFGL